MARQPKQKLKLLRERDILLEYTDQDHIITVAEILEHLTEYGIYAERKSIYEDIEELKSYGMDIVTVRGHSGGYFVASRDFEIAELKVLADAVQSSKFISAGKSRELIKKLSSLAGNYDRAKLSRQVHISDRVKSMNRSIYYTTDYIHTAISENRKISFYYYYYNSKKQKIRKHGGKLYTVSPWLLIWNEENYYLAAYDSEAGIIKHYRVDKMEKVSILDEMREGEDIFKSSDIEMYSTGVFGMFGGRSELVTLECTEDMAGAVIDRFGSEVTMTDGGTLGVRAYVKVQISPRFFGWVMGFGGKMKISAPESAVTEFKASLSEINDLYR